jgi:hypothetical protein
MSQLPPAIAIRIEGQNSFNVAMTVIEELCAQNSGLRGENAALRAETEKLAAENKRLQAQLAQLEAKLGRAAKTSKNSSLPPSQATKPNSGANGARGTAKPQPRRGHPGAHRLLCDTPAAVKDMRANTCPHCAADVSGVERLQLPRSWLGAGTHAHRHDYPVFCTGSVRCKATVYDPWSTAENTAVVAVVLWGQPPNGAASDHD